MTLENFGRQFGVTHVAVLNWEKTRGKPARINPTTELFIRLLILEKLKINNQIFRDTFREFDVQGIAKEQKASSMRLPRPLILPGPHVAKRASARA